MEVYLLAAGATTLGFRINGTVGTIVAGVHVGGIRANTVLQSSLVTPVHGSAFLCFSARGSLASDLCRSLVYWSSRTTFA